MALGCIWPQTGNGPLVKSPGQSGQKAKKCDFFFFAFTSDFHSLVIEKE